MQKEYFTDKQQRTGLVSGVELVTYCTNILLEGKEWLIYAHSLTQIKSQCAFSAASPTPSSRRLQLLRDLPYLGHSAATAGEHKPWVTSARAGVFNKKLAIIAFQPQ